MWHVLRRTAPFPDILRLPETSREKQTWCNCQFDLQEAHPGRTAYDISLDVTDNATDAHVVLRVQKGIYDLTAANLLLETYMHFIDVLSREVSLSLKDTPLFSEKACPAVEVGRGDIIPTLLPDLWTDFRALGPT
jgi:hybrid polyketide synthase/nonribosomal peptide synthetase ACE1